MAEAIDLSMFVKHNHGMAHMDLAVEGVGCAGCIHKIENGMKQLSGITEARLNFTNRRLSVGWREGTLEAGEVIRALERMGYAGHPFEPQRAETEEALHARWLMRCLAVAGFAAMNIMLLSVSVWSGNVSDMTPEVRDFFHWLSALIALPTVAYAGQPFFQSAWRAVRARQLNMDVPISLGVLLAVIMSLIETASHAEHAYFDSAVMLLFFLLCGRYLDHAMRRKTRAIAGNLAALKAEVAHRFEKDGQVVTVPVAAIKPGDRLMVRPGERVPADGVVLTGNSEIDESLVTGETNRRAVTAEATIYAGSMNYGGALSMQATAAGAGTLIDEIERLLEKAVASKSRYVRLAERVARFYAPVVHVTAALTALGWLFAGATIHDAVVTAIAVLIITCPCALALAIPTVQVVASATLFKRGIILNSGDAIERLANVDTVVFDKTGTLTMPEPRVENAAAISPDVLEVAARLALSSRHPLATAVAREARIRTPIDGAVEEPGRGVRAVIDGTEARLGSPEFCNVAKGPHTGEDGGSVIMFSHAKEVIADLKARDLDLAILSGDRREAVAPVAKTLGIASAISGLNPAEKIAAIEQIKANGHRVLMVGDGINDAPALACADVSLSPISAAHITQAHADAVFLGDRLQPVSDAIDIARRASFLMKQNLWLALLYNAIAVPIAISGHATPLIAAMAMSGSSILVTLNALRARQRGRAAPSPHADRAILISVANTP